MNLHVVIKVADSEYVLPATDVLHMESFTGATHVPGTPPHVLGVMQIRRRVVPIVDLRIRFGLPRIAPTLDSRVVVVRNGERTVGLLVDAAREVIIIPPDNFTAPPEVIAREAEGFVSAIAQTGKRVFMLIDSQRVIGEEKLHVG